MTKDRRSPDSEISGTASPRKRSAREPWRERSRGQSEGDKRRAKRSQEAKRALSGEIGNDKNDVRRRGNASEVLFQEEFERQKAAKSPTVPKLKPLPAHLSRPSGTIDDPGGSQHVRLPSAEQVTASLQNIHIIDRDGLLKKWPAKKDGPTQQEEKKDEGRLNEPLLRYLKAKKIPPEMWSDTAAEIERLVGKKLAAAVARPLWDDRGQYPELAKLSAPEFLKRVWADQIGVDGTIEKEFVRHMDPKLMGNVEKYVAKREEREQDAGDAVGLRFIRSRVGRPKGFQAG
jgi:hypothetical protein